MDRQQWNASFSGRRSREAFKHRSLTGFQKAVTQCIRNNIKTAALVIHGGTIMNIMEEYADRPRAFYEWHVKKWRWLSGRAGALAVAEGPERALCP